LNLGRASFFSILCAAVLTVGATSLRPSSGASSPIGAASKSSAIASRSSQLGAVDASSSSLRSSATSSSTDTSSSGESRSSASSSSTTGPARIPSQAAGNDAQGAARQLVESFAKQGIHLDVEHHLCWIPVTIDIRDDLLEYLLVNAKGAAHESLFATEVLPSALATALLALGVEPGENAAWKERTPLPTEEEMRAGVAPYTVEPPHGDGFYLYAGWRTGGETYFYRIEDLLRDLETGRSMRRHRFVYTGSRWVTPKGSAQKSLMADLEGNLVNIALFEQGNTLITAALPECLKQTIWLSNAWLVPERGAEVVLVFARERIAAPPSDLEAHLPEVAAPIDEKSDKKGDARNGR
jgi:hypothetical protein